MTPVIINKNEKVLTALFVDYWAVVKICFFIFVANILVEVLFLMFVGTLSRDGQYRGTVTRYFFSTITGTVGTFSK